MQLSFSSDDMKVVVLCNCVYFISRISIASDDLITGSLFCIGLLCNAVFGYYRCLLYLK